LVDGKEVETPIEEVEIGDILLVKPGTKIPVDGVVIEGYTSVDKINLVFACSKNLKDINMGVLLKDAISLIDGKGGGSKVLAQG
ncbi:P-type ATPase, partial [Clostridioides difficile]